MNLSTAKYIKRSKEIGVRKVLGAERGQLMRQFFGESLITSAMAAAVSVALIELLIPYTKSFTGTNLSLHLFSPAVITLALVAIVILTALISGTYPALFLSSLNPVSISRKTRGAAGLGGSVLKTLVVLQYTISIALIISAIVVHNQLGFVQNASLGFDKNDLVVIPLSQFTSREAIDRFNVYRTEVESDPKIIATTAAYGYPGNMAMGTGFQVTGRNTRSIEMNWDPVDSNYLELLGARMERGTTFSKSHPQRACIINEAAVRAFGIRNPIGRELHVGWGFTSRIIGVVKDFNYESLRNKVSPLVLMSDMPGQFRYLICKISPRDYKQTLGFLKKKWDEVYQGIPFGYSFLDADLGRMYISDDRFGGTVNVFAGMAIVIACLGLSGLASFSVEERTKEIGIRKVLGASVPGIVELLSNDFMKWVLLANVIAWPTAYYFMLRWLDEFAYRTDLSAWVFLLGGGLAFVIATATVSLQAVKVATANPVEALRYE